MKPMHHAMLSGLLTAVLAVSAPAQEPELPPAPIESVDAQQGRQEMIDLFYEVERRLKEIDELLYDASAGDALAGDVAESGIDELLKQSTTRAEEVLTGIDRILEIAEQQGDGSCSSAMESSGSSPLDSQPQGEQGRKEQTPDKPGQQPEPKPGEEPQQQQGGDPQSPREADVEPNNNEAEKPPPEDETSGRIDAMDSTERWGDLPIHVRDLFRTEGGGDMPPQYRDWIDAYYRRLNQAP
jgi:hypothetical protein